VTVYTSLPLQGPQRTLAEGIVNGIRLALDQAGGRAGSFDVVLRSLDDATAEAGRWDPGRTSANARQAAADPTAIAYLGEFNSGASAISIPILNRAGIPQVSPGNTAVGLTSSEAGAEPGEPEKYYPTGERTYLRVVPRDTVQGTALARLMLEQACERVFLLNDRELFGAGLARNIEVAAQDMGLRILENRDMDSRAADYADLVAAAAAQSADCVVFAGSTPSNAVQLFRDFAAGLPEAALFGPDGVAESAFTDPEQGGIPASAARRTFITAPTLSPAHYGPLGQAFFEDYRREYGDRSPEPYAIYGYEAMSLVLDAIERAGERGDECEAVLEQLMETQDRSSVLGTYSIDPRGDTTLTDYGVYRITDGQLEFASVIRGEHPTAP
jgi:branched-chain amino acid transport system substrate-binding protein